MYFRDCHCSNNDAESLFQGRILKSQKRSSKSPPPSVIFPCNISIGNPHPYQQRRQSHLDPASPMKVKRISLFFKPFSCFCQDLLYLWCDFDFHPPIFLTSGLCTIACNRHGLSKPDNFNAACAYAALNQ